MASLRVTDADVLVVWIFYGGQEASPSICACQIWRRAAVRNGKKKMMFSKAAEHNLSTFDKEPDRHPRAFYELEDLNGTPIDGQF
jgi:hypothetical protein